MSSKQIYPKIKIKKKKNSQSTLIFPSRPKFQLFVFKFLKFLTLSRLIGFVLFNFYVFFLIEFSISLGHSLATKLVVA